MKENIKLITSIIAKTTFKWAFIIILGILVTTITFSIALFTNLDYMESGRVAHAGLAGGIIVIFYFGIALLITNFFAFLLVFGLPIFIVLYWIIANKLSVQNAIYLLWEGKAGNYISDKLKDFIKRITEKEGWRKNISDKVVLKAKLLQIAKEDKNTSKLQRKIISFGLKKISLDDIDLKNEKINLSDILITKFENFISDFSKPSLKIFWILILFQVTFLIISLYI